MASILLHKTNLCMWFLKLTGSVVLKITSHFQNQLFSNLAVTDLLVFDQWFVCLSLTISFQTNISIFRCFFLCILDLQNNLGTTRLIVLSLVGNYHGSVYAWCMVVAAVYHDMVGLSDRSGSFNL